MFYLIVAVLLAAGKSQSKSSRSYLSLAQSQAVLPDSRQQKSRDHAGHELNYEFKEADTALQGHRQ